MSKPLLGLILGGILGALDGLTVLFYPAVASEVVGVVIGSTVKGIVCGVLTGFIARKLNSLPLGILCGLLIGAVLAFIIASMPDAKTGQHYYLEIMLPGSIVGAIVGFATTRYGRPARVSASA